MSEGDSSNQIIFNRATEALGHKKRFRECDATQNYVANGQSPAAVVISSGRRNIAEDVGLDVPDVFHLNTLTVVETSPDCPVRVGLRYADDHFTNTNLYLTSMSHDGLLMPYITGELEPGRFMKPWVDMCDRIFNQREIQDFMNKLKLDVRDNDRLAALILSSRSVEKFSLRPERQIQCSYHDAQGVWENHNYNRELNYVENLEDMWRHHKERKLDGIYLPAESPKELHVICSDARVGRIFGKGGNIYSCSVAAIIGNQDDNNAHPVRATAEHAFEHLGVKYATVTGHSNCGGIRAALEYLAHNHGHHPLHPHLEAGLRPAFPMLQQVINYAKRKSFLTKTGEELTPQICKLGEQVVAQMGGGSLMPFFGADKVDTYHLELDTRKVHIVQPYESIAATHANMDKLETLWNGTHREYMATQIVTQRNMEDAAMARQRSMNLLSAAAAGHGNCGCGSLHA